MKCVILAAGEGIRMRPLTIENPKPLLKVAGKSLLEHTFSVLPQEVDEVILVVGYLGEKIRNFCGDNFYGRPVTYVWQAEKLGTGYALRLCKPNLGKGRFLLLYADDLHGSLGIRDCLRHERSLLISEHQNPKKFGVVTLNPDGSVKQIIEKPDDPPTNLVSTGAMVLDQSIFDYESDPHPNGEHYLTSMFDKMLKDHKVMAARAERWFPIATPEDLLAAEKFIPPPS